MSNFKNNLKDSYTIIANDILNSKELSLKAKGLYAFMASKPDNWNFSYDGLTFQLQEGEKAIRSAVKELENVGILIKLPTKNGNKFAGWKWILHPNKDEINLLKGNDQDGHYQKGNDRKGNDQKGNEISNKENQLLKSNNIKVIKEKNI